MAIKDPLPGRPQRGGQINTNLKPIQWTTKKIVLVAIGLGTGYGIILISLITSGAIVPAIVTTVGLVFSLLFVGMLYWLNNSSL